MKVACDSVQASPCSVYDQLPTTVPVTCVGAQRASKPARCLCPFNNLEHVLAISSCNMISVFADSIEGISNVVEHIVSR